MSSKRLIEIFSAGCPACLDAIELVEKVAGPSAEIEVLDMNQQDVAAKAKELGVQSVPAVAIDGNLADCCRGRGVDEATLRGQGLGQ
jgi:glutaredoxin